MAATSRHRGGRPLLALLLAACATRAAGGLLKAADAEKPLFQITLSLDGGRQEVFRVAAGEDPLAAAHAKAAALSFTAEQTDALVAAAREYAQRARVLPVAELRLAPEHGDALVVIFEGDTTPELRAKVCIDASNGVAVPTSPYPRCHPPLPTSLSHTPLSCALLYPHTAITMIL